jgi:hypothetical protein
MKLENEGKKKRDISLAITLSTMYYTGVVHAEVRSGPFDVRIDPGKCKSIHTVRPFCR